MPATTISDNRRDFADLCNRVACGGERSIIERHGTPGPHWCRLKVRSQGSVAGAAGVRRAGTVGSEEHRRELGTHTHDVPYAIRYAAAARLWLCKRDRGEQRRLLAAIDDPRSEEHLKWSISCRAI